MDITAEHVEALAGVYLSPRYDNPQPTPEFHRECWRLYCSDIQQAAVAAPRSHAKSTALTHDYVLANVLFRAERYVMILSSSEELAIEHLMDIATELRENEELRKHFHISHFITDMKTDIIVACEDGWCFRIIARGAEQKIRGRKWMGMRIGLIVCDDLEDDEQVESRDRREKFKRWFFRAVKPALRSVGKVRVHGTILHIDSLLAHLMKNSSWGSLKYRAQASFNDFSNLLWPEQFPEARLRAIRQEFINAGDQGGFSQEYLNDPLDVGDRYLRPEWFLPMEEADHESWKLFAVGVDFAISKQDRANRTSFTVGGKTTSNITCIVDQRLGRWDAAEIIETFFDVEARWHPDCFYVEKGQIWQTLEPILIKEMQRRDVFINYEALTPVNDKKTRGRAFQKRMKTGSVKFDKSASWYTEYESELLMFTGDTEALLDDQFDSTSTLFIGLERHPEQDDDSPKNDEELRDQEELEWLRRAPAIGRNPVTGY